MTLIDDVQTAMVDAMRQKAAARLSALRMLKAALTNREVEQGRALDDAEARRVVTSLVKQRKDSIEQFTKGGREDLAQKEAAEIEILESYLPAAADPAVVERAVVDAIAETGASSPKDMGRVMKAAMARLEGQTVDGKTVSDLVRQRLASGPGGA
ncbi:MAG: GatB/YqeY domain-containing protein [Acidobacteriota bacterium]